VSYYSINYTPSGEESVEKRTSSITSSSYIITMRGAEVEYYGPPKTSSGTSHLRINKMNT
jgi:hypothetical protein